ncbi:MAG: hypothetical protein WCA19_13735 [Candidatus Acidiferrales bacterium]
MFDDLDDYPPDSEEYLDADSYATEVGETAEIAAMQEAEDRRAVWLCNNGREDEPVNGGMAAWWYKALYVDQM